MLPFIASCFQRVLSSGILELVEPKKSNSKFICRDKLSKKIKYSASEQKSSNYYVDSVPLLKVKDTGFDDEGKQPTSIRVKVKMTKQEAALLLSKCKHGGILHFRDVAQHLAELPTDRLSVLTSPICSPINSNALGTIPKFKVID